MNKNNLVRRTTSGEVIAPCPKCGADNYVGYTTWMDAATPDHAKTDKQRDRGVVEWIHCIECKKRPPIREWQRMVEREAISRLGWEVAS